MELVERYLQAVKFALPKAQRDDVLRELSDEILSQVEEKQAALGRPLTEDEQAALLKQIGNPALVAGRYRKQQYLIGPMVFPIYWIVLRWVLVAVVFAMSVGSVMLAVTGAGMGAALGSLARLPLAMITSFAAVTFACALLDYFQAKFDWFRNWDPRKLPKVSKLGKQPSMFDTAADLFFTAVFGVWWLVGLKHQFWIFGPGISFIQLGPVWHSSLYPLFVVLILANLVRAAIRVLRPGWGRGPAWMRLLIHALNLLVLYFLIGARDLFVPVNPNDTRVEELFRNLNNVTHYSLVVITVLTIAQLAWDVYRLARNRGGNGLHAMAA